MEGIIYNTLKVYRSKNIGPVGYKFLINNYGSVSNILNDKEYLEKNTKIIFASHEEVEREIEETYKNGASFVTNIPHNLNIIYDSPPILVYKGNLGCLYEKTLSVVGTRNPTKNGINFCTKLCHSLFSESIFPGFVSVSGGAIGIDSCVLKNSHKSIVVLPSGIKNIYMKDNEYLFNEQNHLLLTENSIFSKIYSFSFLNRNRLIAALSTALLVIESTLKSGSMHTASKAIEYKRKIFTVPGHPLDTMYSGNLELIKKGAEILYSPNDIVFNHTLSDCESFEFHKPYNTEDISLIKSLIPNSFNKLLEITSLQKHQLISILGELEIQGLIHINNGFIDYNII